jgi:hypothetical protein
MYKDVRSGSESIGGAAWGAAVRGEEVVASAADASVSVGCYLLV